MLLLLLKSPLPSGKDRRRTLRLGAGLGGAGDDRDAGTGGSRGRRVLRSYGLEDDKVAAVVKSIRADKKRWVDFMMRFELGLEEPDPKRARNSALTIALSYVAGGMVPLAPYFLFRSVHSALIGSVIVTLAVVPSLFLAVMVKLRAVPAVMEEGKPLTVKLLACSVALTRSSLPSPLKSAVSTP
jgi:hypothetical protein